MSENTSDVDVRKHQNIKALKKDELYHILWVQVMV